MGEVTIGKFGFFCGLGDYIKEVFEWRFEKQFLSHFGFLYKSRE